MAGPDGDPWAGGQTAILVLRDNAMTEIGAVALLGALCVPDLRGYLFVCLLVLSIYQPWDSTYKC